MRALEARSEVLDEGEAGDYLVGTETITELDTEYLRMATGRAWHRWQMLGLLVKVLSGDAPREDVRRHIAHYFEPPAPEQEAEPTAQG